MKKTFKIVLIALLCLGTLALTALYISHNSIDVLEPQGMIGEKERELIIIGFFTHADRRGSRVYPHLVFCLEIPRRQCEGKTDPRLGAQLHCGILLVGRPYRHHCHPCNARRGNPAMISAHFSQLHQKKSPFRSKSLLWIGNGCSFIPNRGLRQ